MFSLATWSEIFVHGVNGYTSILHTSALCGLISSVINLPSSGRARAMQIAEYLVLNKYGTKSKVTFELTPQESQPQEFSSPRVRALGD